MVDVKFNVVFFDGFSAHSATPPVAVKDFCTERFGDIARITTSRLKSTHQSVNRSFPELAAFNQEMVVQRPNPSIQMLLCAVVTNRISNLLNVKPIGCSLESVENRLLYFCEIW